MALFESVREVSPADAYQDAMNNQAVILDVRTPREINAVSVEFAVTDISNDFDRGTQLIIMCATGARSRSAVKQLSRHGFTKVANLKGGIVAWEAAGLPVVRGGVKTSTVPQGPGGRSSDNRYARQLALPEVGATGQHKLENARVLVVGAGGTGTPVLQYLAGAGVGTIGVCDGDSIEVSNLHRQPIHRNSDAGSWKADSAATFIQRLNPDVNVIARREKITSSNAREIISGTKWDMVVDCIDSLADRYAINAAAVSAGIPVVHGAVGSFEGRVTILAPHLGGPCYSCLYPKMVSPELAPQCSVAGVLGPVPGVVGSLQAVEVLKLILGIGEPLVGTLLVWDALGQRFDRFGATRNSRCEICTVSTLQ